MAAGGEECQQCDASRGLLFMRLIGSFGICTEYMWWRRRVLHAVGWELFAGEGNNGQLILGGGVRG